MRARPDRAFTSGALVGAPAKKTPQISPRAAMASATSANMVEVHASDSPGLGQSLLGIEKGEDLRESMQSAHELDAKRVMALLEMDEDLF